VLLRLEEDMGVPSANPCTVSLRQDSLGNFEHNSWELFAVRWRL